MTRLRPLLILAVLLGLPFGCSRQVKGPDRETALAQLRKEAESLKADGEKVDPTLQVSSAWNIEAVEVAEQPNDPASPWKGTIRFRIETRTKDFDGSTVKDQSQKRFEYLWSSALGRWIIKYVPAAR